MLMVDLTMVPFHAKLEKCYCIGVMNQLKVICHDFFSLAVFVHIKMNFYWFNRQELLEKAKERHHNGRGKEEAAKYYVANKDVLKEKNR